MRIEDTGHEGEFRWRAFPAFNELVPVFGCYSEAMMHLGLAGKPIKVAVVLSDGCRPMCQVYVDGEPFSFPITTGEGGFFDCPKDERRDGECGYYTYADRERINP